MHHEAGCYRTKPRPQLPGFDLPCLQTAAQAAEKAKELPPPARIWLVKPPRLIVPLCVV